ncbi:MAG: hypothetical protein UW22_C0022G0012 [Candidatus Gottesmanbacteria bacterium GW2011_GWB1_44_11c]|uniref:Sulphotransferase Stf0 domain-containing protein n=2 Tax=Candidatus Gottesmaniibacteriota TaxID=1752720 RepID=A0A0G1IPC7_9BACT|nr:MAG: hypothetical protein UW22_C0022G0012 [Candidatus Gottesmanbacteria bacterium GW2011_GWB1_44_11c]KKT61020.1 MAG: hypothetical protein UW52_C0013G0022 [Candidatus Gottesmanbacteria bacterium GW2011_GWA1_44_24b]
MSTYQTYQKFIILTMPRSGSNYLSYLLNDHPNIMSIGEVYCRETIWGQPGKTHYNHNYFLKLFRDISPTMFLKLFVYHKYSKHIVAVGFRLFYHQAEHFRSILEHLYKDKSVKVIHLKRINLLENLVSLNLAEKTGHWSSFGENKSKNEKLFLTYEECLNHFVSSTNSQNKFESLFQDHPQITVYYENFLVNHQAEIDRTLTFLGVKKRNLNCSLKKQNTRPLNEVIINYQDLKRQFSHTKWSVYFKN